MILNIDSSEEKIENNLKSLFDRLTAVEGDDADFRPGAEAEWDVAAGAGGNE